MTYRKPAHRPLLASVKDALTDGRLRRPLGRLTAVGLGALSPIMALANPTGGQVVGGQASISNSGANGTLVRQTSQNAVINWQQFSVGANQYVQFLQPDSSAVVLNRVIGGNPSSILGNISANGQVFLINPNGILFGRGAVLDVSSLVASTQDISNADFMAGRYRFTKAAGAPDASVVNQGTISANGGYVVLAGDYVENDGVINAQSGRVLLAAGGGTTLTLDKSQGLISYSIDSATLARLAGANNTGSITADGGTVIMTADVANALTATAVNNSGFIAAHSITSHNGVIVLMAKGGDIDNSGTLDASATDSGVAGGTVIVRGDGHTQLAPTSVIDASGDGAKGGFVELSGHTLHIGGQVDAGPGGNLLIDPIKLKIVTGAGGGTPSTSSARVGVNFIQNKLNSGQAVTLVAQNSITNAASVTALTATAGTGALTVKTGSLNVTVGGTLAGFSPNHCISAGVCHAGSTVVFTATSGTINLTGMSINIKGAFTANALQGTANLGAVQAKSVAITGGTINLAGNVTASVGRISIAAHHGPATPATVTVAPGKVLTGSSVNILASGSYGGKITVGDILAVGGSINLHAQQAAGIGTGPASINAGNLTATKFVDLMRKGTAAGGAITVTGAIKASTGSVNVTQSFSGERVVTLSSTSKITASKGVTVSGAKITMGSVSVAGPLVVTSSPGAASAAAIHVTAGKVLKAGAINLAANDTKGANITLGDATATGGSIHISANDSGLVSGSGVINAGNLTGKGINMLVLGPNKVGLNVGAINAERINISASGKSDTVVTGALTAVNTASSAVVRIGETANVTGTLTVNGNITVSGKPHATFANALGGIDLPEAAALSVGVGGSGNGNRVVQVNGTINVTAIAAAYSGHSHNEGGVVNNRSQSGVGGVATADIFAAGSHGAASVTGSIAAKGPDAFVAAQAHSVTLHNITVTGSGHHVSRSILARATTSNNPVKNSYSSSNSAGQAELLLGSFPTGSVSPPGVSATVKAGNITVSGKGAAHVGLLASNVSAGNVTVTATAAKGHRTQKGNVFGAVHCSGFNCNSGQFFRGPRGVALHSGSLSLGAAGVEINGGTGFGNGGSSSGPHAVSINAGALSVTGVGAARIRLSGKTITTLGLSAVATKGTIKGTGSSVSGGNGSIHFAHTFNINGGGAEIKVRSGNSSSHSSGVLTLNGGPVTIGGNVTASGPAAGVDIKGKTVKVAGTLTVTGSGGSVNSDTVVTGATAYHTHFTGSEPTSLNLQGGASGSVSVAGKTSIKAPGIIGAIMIGGSVKLNGFSGSASAAKSYSVLDTRVSPTAQAFTAASIGLIVADVKAVGGGAVFASASDTGNVTVKSRGNVNLPSEIKISGDLNVQAVGSIVGSSNGLVGRFNAIDASRPRAGSQSGGGPGKVTLPHLSATANAMSMVAGQNINVSGGQLNIGNGSTASVHGDSTLFLGLAAEKLSPASPNPNGDFIAGGAVTLGGLNLTGSYLLLQGSVVSVLGKMSVPAGTLVQVAPFDPAAAMDIEDTTLLSAVFTQGVITFSATSSTFGLTNSAFLSLFPGDTIVVGNSAETGSATLGANGPINIGSTNLIIDTTGSITGLSTVISTGKVLSLLSILGPPIPPVTSGEITGSTTNTGLGDQTDKKKLGQPSGGTGTGQQGGTISSDTSGTGVCH